MLNRLIKDWSYEEKRQFANRIKGVKEAAAIIILVVVYWIGLEAALDLALRVYGGEGWYLLHWGHWSEDNPTRIFHWLPNATHMGFLLTALRGVSVLITAAVVTAKIVELLVSLSMFVRTYAD